MSKIVKSMQSCSNGHLPYLSARSMHDVACDFACAVAKGANVLNRLLRSVFLLQSIVSSYIPIMKT